MTNYVVLEIKHNKPADPIIFGPFLNRLDAERFINDRVALLSEEWIAEEDGAIIEHLSWKVKDLSPAADSAVTATEFLTDHCRQDSPITAGPPCEICGRIPAGLWYNAQLGNFEEIVWCGGVSCTDAVVALFNENDSN
jgi:hypothetical protein